MRDSDAESVARVLRAAFRRPGAGSVSSSPGPDLPLTAERVLAWRRSAAGAWVAEVSGFGPVGAAFAVVEPHAAWLAGLGVLPEFRGAGLGAVLTDHALTFLSSRERRVIGMEATPAAVGAAALYTRRGFRVADTTVRLRGSTPSLIARADPGTWREATGDDLDRVPGNPAPSFAARVRAQPRSRESFLLYDPHVVLLCDPDPLIPAAAGSLDVRLVMPTTLQPANVGNAVQAAARSAATRGLGAVEIDLALADGLVFQQLTRLALTPIASTVRLVDDRDAYADWIDRNGPVGRWSF